MSQDNTKQALIRLIAEHGLAIARDPQRCQSLLEKACGNREKDLFLLLAAYRGGVVKKLLGTGAGQPIALVIRRVGKHLHKRFGLVEEGAVWAVEAWAVALGLCPHEAQGEFGNQAVQTRPATVEVLCARYCCEAPIQAVPGQLSDCPACGAQILFDEENGLIGNYGRCPVVACTGEVYVPTGGGRVGCDKCNRMFTVNKELVIIGGFRFSCALCNGKMSEAEENKYKCSRCGMRVTTDAQGKVTSCSDFATCQLCNKEYLVKPNTGLCPRCGKPIDKHHFVTNPIWYYFDNDFSLRS